MSVPALAQRARGAIGLRGRIVAVVLITTVATLAIAAVLVLGPLENSLRKADEQALEKAIPPQRRQAFERLPLGDRLLAPAAQAPAVSWRGRSSSCRTRPAARSSRCSATRACTAPHARAADPGVRNAR